MGLKELASMSGAYWVRNRRKAASRSEVTAEELKEGGAIDQRHCENLVQIPVELLPFGLLLTHT